MILLELETFKLFGYGMPSVECCKEHDAPLQSFQLTSECDVLGSDHTIRYCPIVGCTEFAVHPKGRLHQANYGMRAFIGVHVLGKQLSIVDGK